MRQLSQEEIISLNWCDAEFYGFSWLKDVEEPTLAIQIHPENSSVTELIGVWCSNLAVDLKYNNHVGSILTWQVCCKKDNNQWNVTIDLAHQGSVTFNCNKLFVCTLSDRGYT